MLVIIVKMVVRRRLIQCLVCVQKDRIVLLDLLLLFLVQLVDLTLSMGVRVSVLVVCARLVTTVPLKGFFLFRVCVVLDFTVLAVLLFLLQ